MKQLLASLLFLVVAWYPAERRIASSPVEWACAWQADGTFLGCARGNRDVAAPPGTAAQLQGGIVSHNQPYPHTPAVQYEDVVVAYRNGWSQLRVVQGRYLRAVIFKPGMTLPTWNEYVQTLTANFRRYGVWFRSDNIYGFAISGGMHSIMQAWDNTWKALAAAHGFLYAVGP